MVCFQCAYDRDIWDFTIITRIFRAIPYLITNMTYLLRSFILINVLPQIHQIYTSEYILLLLYNTCFLLHFTKQGLEQATISHLQIC